MDTENDSMNRDIGAEAFEKVDKIPEQDEEVTTTSFSGETVEADRYEPDYTSQAKTSGSVNTENLLDLDYGEQYGQNAPSNFDQFSSSNTDTEPLKPSAPPASGFDLLGETESDTYENSPITSSSEKETPVKLPERKDAVAAPAGNGPTASITILHRGLLLYSCSFDINGLLDLYLLIIIKKNIYIMVGKKLLQPFPCCISLDCYRTTNKLTQQPE